MNYTQDVKREIYNKIEKESYEKKLSFLTAITKNLGQIKAFSKDDDFLTYEIKEEELASITSTLLIELYNIDHEIEEIDIEPKMYVISISKEKANKMLHDMSLSHFEGKKFVEEASLTHISKISNKEKAEGYLQGIFASLGSVYFPQENPQGDKRDRGYHLEIVFLEKGHALAVQQMLQECKISLTYLERESTFTLYSKNSENISDTLAFLGASGVVLKLNSVSIERYMNNEINRVSNIEAANMDKTAIANAKYIDAIETIDNKISIDKLKDEKIKLVCKARLEDKTSSLSVLAKKLNMTKSSLNRVFIKIMQMAEKLED